MGKTSRPVFGSSCRDLGRISALPAPQRAHLQSGDGIVPASQGLDPRGAAQVNATGSVPAMLTPTVARSGQGHQQCPGPRRAFERCRRPWAHIPTTTHTGRRPFQCRSGAKVTWNRREGLVGGGWGQDRVPDDLGLGASLESTPGPVTAPCQAQPPSLAWGESRGLHGLNSS